MRTTRLARWSGSVLSPRTRPNLARVRIVQKGRCQSTVAIHEDSFEEPAEGASQRLHRRNKEHAAVTKENWGNRHHYTRHLPSPPLSAALASSKLNALHARLQLPSRFPVETLARCLVHQSADQGPNFNNTSLAVLGRDLLGYYTSELILCTYPRLPLKILFAAMKAYVGPAAACAIVKEWGVQAAAEPGGEVDPGLLQFLRKVPGNADLAGDGKLQKDIQRQDDSRQWTAWKLTDSSLSIAETHFGPLDVAERPELAKQMQNQEREESRVTLEDASLSFLQAVMGALYLHSGRDAAKAFFDQHIRSRKLDVSRMFYFEQPTRDLSRLCAREGFERPVARIVSETGRRSRHPVFVIGVFSGREKLGEGAGGSLDEARIRAAIAALKGWYLYSPLKVIVPSDVEGKEGAAWEPAHVDGGEVIV